MYPAHAQVLELVRIEVDVSSHQQFQVTVASPDLQLTAAAKTLLALHLARMPSASRGTAATQ